MRRLLPLLAAAAAGAGAAVARRRSGSGASSGTVDASPTAADPAERAAAAQATPPGPAPAPPPEPGSATAALQGEAAAPAPEATGGEAQTVGLYALHEGDRAEQARASLAAALGAGATLGSPDSSGRFDVQLPAPSPEAAQQQVRAAFASSGTGDDFTVVTTTAGRELPSDDPRQPD